MREKKPESPWNQPSGTEPSGTLAFVKTQPLPVKADTLSKPSLRSVAAWLVEFAARKAAAISNMVRN